MKTSDLRAGKTGKLAVILALLCMAAVASALNVVNTHTVTGEILTAFTVPTSTNYYHAVQAPSGGNVNSVVLKILSGDTTIFPQLTRHNGACETQTLNLGTSPTSYCLKSWAFVTSGTAKACVRSTGGPSDCCPFNVND